MLSFTFPLFLPLSCLARPPANSTHTHYLPDGADPQEERRLWNHVKHLENQLEILAASKGRESEAYNDELTKTLANLSKPEPVGHAQSTLRAQHRVAPSPGGGVAASAGASGTSRSSTLGGQAPANGSASAPLDDDEKKLWNAWDVRLNIGLEVGKWFGHALDEEDAATAAGSSAPSQPGVASGATNPLDLGADPMKRASNSLPYADVLELNKRLSVIEALAGLTGQMQEARNTWQNSLAKLRATVDRTQKQQAATASSKTFQDAVAAKLNGANGAFLKTIDALLHQTIDTADIWGDRDSASRQIEQLTAQLDEYGVRLRNELDTRAQLTNQAADLARRLADEQERTSDLDMTSNRIREDRNVREQKLALAEAELAAAKDALASAEGSARELRDVLAKERQDAFATGERLHALEAANRDLVAENERLKTQQMSEKALRESVARECADLRVALAHAKEECEIEQNTAAELRTALAASKASGLKLDSELEAANEKIADQMVRLTEMRLEAEGRRKELAILQAQLSEDEYQKTFLETEREKAVSAAEAAALDARTEAKSLRAELKEQMRINERLKEQNDLIFAELDELQSREETDLVLAELRRMLADALAQKQELDALCTAARNDKVAAEDAALLAKEKAALAVAAAQAEVDAVKDELARALAKVEASAGSADDAKGRSLAEAKKRAQAEGLAEQLRDQVAELKQMNAVLLAEKDVLRTEIGGFEAELEKEIHAHAVKGEELAKLQRDCEDLRMRYDHERQLHADAIKARERISSGATELEALLADMHAAASSHAHQVDELRRQLDSVGRARDQLRAARDETASALDAAHATIDGLEDTRNNLERELNEARKARTVEAYQTAEVQKKLDEALREISSLHLQQDYLKQAKASSDAQLAASRGKVDVEAAEKTELSVHLVAIERQLANAKDQIGEMRLALEAEQKKSARLEQDVFGAASELAQLKRTHAETKEALAQVLGENADLVRETRELEAELSHMRKKLQADVTEKDSLARGCETKDAEISAYRKQNEALTNEKYALQRELEQVSEAAKLAGRDRASFELEKMRVAQDVTDARKRLELKSAELEQTLAAWQADKERMEARLAENERKHAEASSASQASMDSLHKAMNDLNASFTLKASDYEDEIEHYKRQVHAGLVREEELALAAAAAKSAADASAHEAAGAVAREEKLDEELRHLKLRHKKLTNTCDEALDRVRALEAELRETARSSETASSDASELSTRLEAVKAQLKDANDTLLARRGELRAREEAVAQLENERKTAELEIARMQKRLDKEAFACANLSSELSKVQAAQLALAKEKASFETDLAAARSEAAEYKKQCKDLLEAQSAAALEKQALTDELALLRRQADMLSNDENAKLNALRAATADVDDFKMRLGKHMAAVGRTSSGGGGNISGLVVGTASGAGAGVPRGVSFAGASPLPTAAGTTGPVPVPVRRR